METLEETEQRLEPKASGFIKAGKHEQNASKDGTGVTTKVGK